MRLINEESFQQLTKTGISSRSLIRVNVDDAAHRNPVGRMTEYYTLKNEMAARAALMVRAADELLKLTHDLKEFLILHDFNFLSSAIERYFSIKKLISNKMPQLFSAEGRADLKMKDYVSKYDNLRLDTASVINDIDKELNEHFSLRQ
ncbi:unnamed protein product [Anisakis simplex]|uniref:Mediator of RNA polymerase II transcription subunit 22 n=1 Tax=Anisakis simplex TaxID=6269 RepID=A0A0M3J363_ANISI|nr:unnamed protein product [Anisakis simplex]